MGLNVNGNHIDMNHIICYVINNTFLFGALGAVVFSSLLIDIENTCVRILVLLQYNTYDCNFISYRIHYF